MISVLPARRRGGPASVFTDYSVAGCPRRLHFHQTSLMGGTRRIALPGIARAERLSHASQTITCAVKPRRAPAVVRVFSWLSRGRSSTPRTASRLSSRITARAMAFFPMPAVELDAGLRPQLRGDLADDRRPADRLGLAQRAEDGDLLGPQFGEVMDLGGVACRSEAAPAGGAAGGGIAASLPVTAALPACTRRANFAMSVGAFPRR